MVRYIFSALALVSSVVAQQCSTSGTTTITASADATALASCTTYSGSVAIPTGLAVPKDANGHQTLRVDNVRKIAGNLTVTNNPDLTSLTFSALQQVTGFEIGGCNQLSQLSCPQLTTVTQFNLTALAQLQNLDFGGTGITKASSILITNTGLTSLDGISNLQSVDIFNVNNNQALQNISLEVTSITNSLDIEANDGFQTGLTTSFPLLETAQNMTFRNCSQILLPSLRNVTDDLGFYGNTFVNFTAPKLTTTGGLIFAGNTELTNISLPALTSINQTYQIANNTKLVMIDGFQKLYVIKGALDFSGNFSDVELPALIQQQGAQVQGAFNLQTSAEFNCSAFDKAYANKVIKGHYFCQGTEANPSTAGNEPSTTSGSSSSRKSGAAVPLHIDLPMVIGGSSVLAWFLQLVL